MHLLCAGSELQIREGLKKIWNFFMAFAIKRRPSPLNGPNFHPVLPHLFSFAIESYLYETDFTSGPSQYHYS